MTAEEIKIRLSQGEDSAPQFKRGSIGIAKLASELAAFTNAAGGVIFFGVEDDGTICGLSNPYAKKLDSKVANASNDSVRPAIYPRIEANDFVSIVRYGGVNTPPQGVNTQSRGVNTPSRGVNAPPSEKEKTLLELIKEHSGERIPFFAGMTGRSEKSIEHEIAHLKFEPAKIEFRGAPKTGDYYILERSW